MTTIEKIHREVDTAQDRLLQKSTMIVEMNKPSSTHDKKIEKAERLTKLGFTSAAPIYEAEALKEKDTFVVKTKEEAERILYYKQTYPLTKFLTEAELNRICTKYNLVYAEVEKYTGDVPEKNLRDIENAQKLKSQDQPEKMVTLDLNFHSDTPNHVQQWFKNRLFKFDDVIDKDRDRVIDHNKMKKMTPFPRETELKYFENLGSHSIVHREGLFIAAPKSMFDLKGLKKHGLGYFAQTVIKPQPKDPVVFRYVKDGIQVITAWGGPEASDPEVVLGIKN